MRPLALSTCWNSHRHQDGRAMLEEIRKLGFRSVELGHGIRFSLWPGILQAWENKVIEITSLHNFCPVPIDVYRPDPNCFEFSDQRRSQGHRAGKATEETIRHAAKLGATTVVLHLGWAGPRGITRRLETLYLRGHFLERAYTQAKVRAVEQRRKNFPQVWARVRACLEPLVALAGELKIKLGFETRAIFEEFPHEEEMEVVLNAFPAEVVGYWHDFGHAARKEFLGWHSHRETVARRAGRLIGCHVHDCHRLKQDHLPLSHGEIEFSTLLPLFPREAMAVLELEPDTPAEQVMASRHLWNSYVAALG